MHPLPTHTVDLVLHLISPLSDPLPPHLISTPLRQRHHFLQISPSSPVEYLCWPSPDNAKTIDLLDRLPPLSDHASFSTRYTSDPESTVAHVQISSDAHGLRMLFHWDETDGWKYHDLRLMPFPNPSYSTPHESLQVGSNSACNAADPSRHSSPEVDHINSADDDAYWDAYGAVGYDLTSSVLPQSGTDAVKGEDAYWAQYASVQGCYFRTNSKNPSLTLRSIQVPLIPRCLPPYPPTASSGLLIPLTMNQPPRSHRKITQYLTFRSVLFVLVLLLPGNNPLPQTCSRIFSAQYLLERRFTLLSLTTHIHCNRLQPSAPTLTQNRLRRIPHWLLLHSPTDI